MKRSEAVGIRRSLDSLVVKIVDNPVEINDNMVAIRPWAPSKFKAETAEEPADVRMYEGIPYKCVLTHDSTGNDTWNPAATPALWMQYHGTSKATARPWLQPTGAHDMYKAGEWMIWTDGLAYPCLSDTTYSPADYPQAWGTPESID